MNEAVNCIYVSEGVSSRTNKKYSVLCVEFVSGYTYKAFLNDEQRFAIESSGLEVRK